MPQETLQSIPYTEIAKLGELIGGRQNTSGRIPFGEVPDPVTHLFPSEEQLCDQISLKCREYMSPGDLGLTYLSLVTALAVHQNKYRYTHDPSFLHVGGVAKDLADDEMDSITVSAGGIHDTFEDTQFDKEPFNENSAREIYAAAGIPNEIVDELVTTVGRLSIFTGEMKKSMAMELGRMSQIGSLLDDPRVIIIKLKDRLRNMQKRDLQALPDPRRIARNIKETEEFYRPLAMMVGMYKEGEELDELCLRNRSEIHDQFANLLVLTKEVFFQTHDPEQVRQELADLGSLDKEVVHTRTPGLNDIYRRMGGRIVDDVGKLRIATDNDFYLNVDISLNGMSTSDPLRWSEAAMNLATKYTFLQNGEYELIEPINEIRFRNDVLNDRTDVLLFELRRKSDGLRVVVRIYPQDNFELSRVSLKDMYWKRAPLPSDDISTVVNGGDEIAKRHYWALQRYKQLRRRYKRIMSEYNQTNVLSSSQVIRLMEKIPVGKIIVKGIDDKGEGLSWVIDQNATVMDYVRDIFRGRGGLRGSWPTVIGATINGRPVALNQKLQPGDEIHIIRDKKKIEHWSPHWIHYFHTDKEGSQIVRDKIRRLLEKTTGKERKLLETDVASAGKWVIGQAMHDNRIPLRIGIDRAMHLVHQHFPDMDEREFLFNIGMGDPRITTQLIREVATELEIPNQQAGVMEIVFGKDQRGLVRAVSSTLDDLQISLTDVESEILADNVPVVVRVYLDPSVLEEYGYDKLKQIIKSSNRCIGKGLIDVRPLRRAYEMV
ncbi:HD domain-containing protein [Patescibacteria group bacterium]|nr:HD domain-containing protein [Patescibacteria group bacterium]MCL5797585.1 HD domain-containing protein [Patescibacteria group bacterium]